MGRAKVYQSSGRITLTCCELGTWYVPGVKSDLLLALLFPLWTLSRAPGDHSPRDKAWAPAQPLVGLLAPGIPLLSALGPCALSARPKHALTQVDSLSLSHTCETQATHFIPYPAGETEAKRH